ncbi:class I SAM-dependent methyltransferase [Actinomadura rudentiformis]|uniref:Class I SAM-dependent methyltransferase n=1 Tax=Actinomadura rudentiformis TaxID=359158 RepID=A0A6H9YNZ5_9ACTN|nr:class I SAM-dependent methyltransferase [Actinomadura rudentiformis]KAB2341630.1 class I SAM-dependent methyltransferase [Actinomadura rudentiformis]
MALPRTPSHQEQTASAAQLPRPAPPSHVEPPCPFDAWASTYDSSLLQYLLYRPVHQAVLQHAHQHQPNPARILDVGCGTGHLLRSAAQTYPHADLAGIDPSTEMLGRAAQVMPAAAIWFARARVEALPFRDATFDLVLSTLALRHWHDARKGLTEISRVTTRTGVVVIADVLQPPPRQHKPRRWTPQWPRSARHRDQMPVPAGVHHAVTVAGLEPDHLELIHLTMPMTTTTLIVARRRSAVR